MEENAVNLQDENLESIESNLEQQETEVENEAPAVEAEDEPKQDENDPEDVSIEDLPLPTEDSEKKKELPKWAEKRISKKEKELAQKEAEAAMYKAELERIKSGAPALIQQDDVVVPNRDDYASEDEYLDARFAYNQQKEQKKNQLRAHQHQMMAAEAEFRNKWNSAHDEGSKKYDDFEDKVELLSSPSFPANRAMAEKIARSEHGADILYFLGTYSQKAREIALMNPVDAITEVTKIEMKIKQSKGKPSLTKAPPVIKSINTNSGGKVQSDPSNMSPNDFEQWYKAKYASKR